MAWEYADLFDVPLKAEEQLDMWTAAPVDLAVGRMGYRTRTIKAGPRMEIDIYPQWGRLTISKAKRAKKQFQTIERILKANEERGRRYAVRLLDANFTKNDYALHLTYAEDEPSYENCQRQVRNFLRRVKRKYEKANLPDPKYFYTIEDELDTQKVKRHVHMAISGGIPKDELKSMWKYGWDRCENLDPTERGLEALAMYYTKQQRNRHRWCASKNLKKPLVRISNTKVRNSQVKRIARNIENEAKAVLQKLYPQYRFVNCVAHGSDIMPGVYIHVLMRHREDDDKLIERETWRTRL